MSLKKRHFGRRVAGVGVGVALLVLGLEAPAFAAAPTTVTSFTPTSGPADCVVDITGTGFTTSADTDTHVNFVNATDATDVTEATVRSINSATDIWATVPGLTPGTEYKIEVDSDTLGDGTASTATFLATTGSGGCAPTITSFAPTCNTVGTVVVITGTNLIGPDLSGGEVRFNPYTGAEVADFTVPDVSDLTSLSVIVPSTAKTGPIEVTTWGTFPQVISTGDFQVVADPALCPSVGPTTHARTITLKLSKTFVAKGKVSSTEATAFTDCVASAPVKIQRRTSGHWKTVGKTTTNDTGAYKKKIRKRAGKYRAVATKFTLNDGADVCLTAKSRVVKRG